MVFNSNVFLLLFFPVVFGLFWLSPTKRWRYVVLTLSGYVFYGYWDWRYCFLLAFSSLVSFFAALMIQHTEVVARRRFWLVVAVSTDLILLGFFKYYNFAASIVNGLTGAGVFPLLNIILPVGISFYTFHTISYIVDVAQRRVRATDNIWEYFTYVCLFSQLVAGPIVRFRQIEDDLEHIDRRLPEDYVAKGVVPQNFNVPYRALGIRDFWRRWHMSLSSWLRDYVYISLGGNQKGPTRTQVNLLVTMFLGGLWHGANWTFVVWGLYHGSLLLADRHLEPLTSRLPSLIFRLVTFLLVVVGWVLFRSDDFSMAAVWLLKMAGQGPGGAGGVPLALLAIIAVCLVVSNTLRASWDFPFKPTPRWAILSASCLFVAYLFMNSRDTVFLYYQF